MEFNEPLPPNILPLYQDNRTRYPNLTDVIFIDETHLVVAHRYACKLYYIEIICNNKYNIIDTYILKLEGKPHQTEMMEYNNGIIYLIAFSEYMFRLCIKNNKITLLETIKLCKNKVSYHGIQYYNNSIYITPSLYNEPEDGKIIKYDIKTKKINSIAIKDLSNIRYKDITFLSDDYIVLICNYKKKTTMFDKNHFFDGFIGIFTKNFKLIDKIDLPHMHFDSVTSKDGIFYATAAGLEGDFIYIGNCVNNKINIIKKLPVEAFPHGITIHNDKLAYTSYGTSSLYILDIPTILL